MMRRIVLWISFIAYSVVVHSAPGNYGSCEQASHPITSVGLHNNELWYAGPTYGIYSKKTKEPPRPYPNGRQYSILAVGKDGTKAFGGNGVLAVDSDQSLQPRVEGTVTALDITPDGRYIIAATQFKPSNADYSIFNVDLSKVAYLYAGNKAARLCASRKVTKPYKPPAEDEKSDDNQESYEIVTVCDDNIVRLVTFDMSCLRSGELFHQTPGKVNDIVWANGSTVCMACDQGFLLKSFQEDKESSLFSGQQLCAVKEIDDKNIIVGVKDGRVHIMHCDGYDYIVKTVQVHPLPMHYIACDLSDEAEPRLAFIVDSKAGDTNQELLDGTQMQVIRKTFDELESMPEWKETLSLKQRVMRMLGGVSCIAGIGVALYWLTYCAHQKQGTFC